MRKCTWINQVSVRTIMSQQWSDATWKPPVYHYQQDRDDSEVWSPRNTRLRRRNLGFYVPLLDASRLCYSLTSKIRRAVIEFAIQQCTQIYANEILCAEEPVNRSRWHAQFYWAKLFATSKIWQEFMIHILVRPNTGDLVPFCRLDSQKTSRLWDYSSYI